MSTPVTNHEKDRLHESLMSDIASALTVMQNAQDACVSILNDMLEVGQEPNVHPELAKRARGFLMSIRDEVLNAIGLIQVPLRSPYVMESPRDLSTGGDTLTIFEVIDSRVSVSWLILREIAPSRAEEFHKRLIEFERTLPRLRPKN